MGSDVEREHWNIKKISKNKERRGPEALLRAPSFYRGGWAGTTGLGLVLGVRVGVRAIGLGSGLGHDL